jgi:hypothetical protein
MPVKSYPWPSFPSATDGLHKQPPRNSQEQLCSHSIATAPNHKSPTATVGREGSIPIRKQAKSTPFVVSARHHPTMTTTTTTYRQSGCPSTPYHIHVDDVHGMIHSLLQRKPILRE